MSPEEQEIENLCVAIIHEQDPARFTKLVEKLNETLELRERKRVESVAANPSPKVEAS